MRLVWLEGIEHAAKSRQALRIGRVEGRRVGDDELFALELSTCGSHLGRGLGHREVDLGAIRQAGELERHASRLETERADREHRPGGVCAAQARGG